MTYKEAYRKARVMVGDYYGKKTIVIVKNEKGSHRAYEENYYRTKKIYFPIIVKKM